MLAGDDYKHASRLVEAADAAQKPDWGVPGGVLRLSWALSRIAAVPTPDLAQQLAAALIEMCGPDHAVAAQLGRLDEDGRWRGESYGVAGRLSYEAAPELAAIDALPWPRWPAETPAYVVSEPPRGEPSMRPIETALHRVNLGLELAALACPPERGRIVLTVQLGGPLGERSPARASLLARVLPWAHAIARTALGECEGMEPRSWLTEKECAVLARLVRGASVVEIAGALDRSRFTVHDHVKSLHRKLGVRTHASLVGLATMGVPPPEVLK